MDKTQWELNNRISYSPGSHRGYHNTETKTVNASILTK